MAEEILISLSSQETRVAVVEQGLLQDVAEAALGHRDQDVQRHRGCVVLGQLVLDQQVADLRTVAVGDDHVVSALYEDHQLLADATRVLRVVVVVALLAGHDERVAAHRDHDGRRILTGLGGGAVHWNVKCSG